MEQQEAAHCESEQLPSRVHCKKCQMCPRDQVCPAGYYGSTRSSKGSRSAIFLSDHTHVGPRAKRIDVRWHCFF
jgi:hypothetical protein